MVDRAIADVLNTKIVKNEDKKDGVPFVAPNSRAGGSLKLSHYIEVRSEEIFIKHAILG